MPVIEVTCPSCDGVGKKRATGGNGFTDADCSQCRGEGTVQEEDIDLKDYPYIL